MAVVVVLVVALEERQQAGKVQRVVMEDLVRQLSELVRAAAEERRAQAETVQAHPSQEVVVLVLNFQVRQELSLQVAEVVVQTRVDLQSAQSLLAAVELVRYLVMALRELQTKAAARAVAMVHREQRAEAVL